MPSFKVIVVGGGPVGLTAAHALSKAGIDFVVLERRPEVFEEVGASLVIFPHNLRVLSQFGLLPRLREIGHEVLRWADYTRRGIFSESWHMYSLKANHGSFSYMLHRAQLIKALFEGLRDEDQARIHTNKKLASIENTSDGVVVTCEDGSKYEGSIVLGADGVHSPTRQFLRDHYLKATPEAEVDDEAPFSVEYRTMWCSLPRRHEYAPGDHCITHGNLASLQLLNSSKRAWLFLYEKLDEPAKERVSYGEADMEAFAAKHGDMVVGDRLKLRDIISTRESGGMANLEEGVLKHWSSGRIVLAGDACHKYTPNAGLGLNNGIQDVVALVNELHRCLESVGQGISPGSHELAAAFKRYEEPRKALAREDLDLSAHLTRLCAWPNTGYWLFDQYVMGNIPGLNEIFLRYSVSPKISRGLCLDFVESEEPFQGRVPWVHTMRKSVTEPVRL
ncbi:2-heptyl-3-hydroxy-4(1H)-quinolone synthase [Cytospora mali]|uniref:2-heptyl-3-hydroxy-4(1H)-quinolone synthase n=1 Tax=Cytospora mali TaxID=578113 RepID=A0A194UMQ0_CYTMA|nr:2-heptyl-3-hydroxy-4(1H)-quinolone synthase [Valsa mali var. pyri (nom. inval.)]